MLKNNLVLGTEVFSGNWGKPFSKKIAEQILILAYNNGLIEIDTAPSYGKLSKVEKLIGNISKKKSLKFKILTKFEIKNKKNKILDHKDSVNEVKKQLDNSLKNLNTDCIEIYYFHSGTDNEFFNDKVWNYLNKRKKLGDIKKLGLSIKHDFVINNKLSQLYNAKKYGISTIQTVLNLYSKQSLKKVIPFCIKNNLEIYGRMPLAKGLLTGKYNDRNILLKNDPRKHSAISSDIIKFKLSKKNLNLEKVIKWPLKNVKKVVFSVKNTNQLKEIMNIFKNKKL